MSTTPTTALRAQTRDAVDVEAPVDRPFWKVPPLNKTEVKLLALAWVVVTASYILIGFAIVEWWEPSGAGRTEARFSRWLDSHRSDSRTHAADIGSALSNTETKIALLVLLLPLMLWMYRRWHDWALITIGLIFEVTVFFTASKIVRRERPDIEQLDKAPTFSWPSGHIAAAVVFYVGLATIVFWNTKSRLSRVVFAVIAVAAPLTVAASRLYLGMHYVTDVLGGIVLGLLALVIVRTLLLHARDGRPLSDPAP